MSESLAFTAHDRVLIVAPHPDDESIASAGLILSARSAGSALRVVVATDGDNNPWPQRWVEKRWHIGDVERSRWGARRRIEAQAALNILGMDSGDARFLGLPDQGLTELLMRGDMSAEALLQAQIDEFRPNIIVLPTLDDRHPDHSALHVWLRLLLARSVQPYPRLIGFSVHGGGDVADRLSVALDAEALAAKRAAILAHASQMRLSQRRFLAHAQPVENFQRLVQNATANPDHAIHAEVMQSGALRIRVDLQKWHASLRGTMAWLLLDCGEGGVHRWIFSANGRAGNTEVLDFATNRAVATASLARDADRWSATLRFADAASVRQGYVKLASRHPGLLVLDRCGWQSLALVAPT